MEKQGPAWKIGPLKFLRAQPRKTPEGQFSRLPVYLFIYLVRLLSLFEQSGTFETLKAANKNLKGPLDFPLEKPGETG